MSKNYTIKDIAKALGLSHGTVDRVIHNRYGVSEATRKKVKDFLAEIDFKPNVIARSLKGSRPYSLSVLIPYGTEDRFWEQAINGVTAAQKEFSEFTLSVDIQFYNAIDTTGFQKVANDTLSARPDGILIAPLFYRESLDFFAKCQEAGIPCTTFNSYIEGAQVLSFIGQDLFKSGKVAADLLDRISPRKGKILVVHLDEDPANSSHMFEKERGFRSFFNEKEESGYELRTFNVNKQNQKEMQGLIKLLTKEETIAGIFVSTSKVHDLVTFVDKEKLKEIPVIGYDLVELNIDLLKEGVIDFLINQDPYRQAFLGITFLFEHLLFQKALPAKKLLPIDVVTAQNYDTYIDPGESKMLTVSP